MRLNFTLLGENCKLLIGLNFEKNLTIIKLALFIIIFDKYLLFAEEWIYVDD